ncbi:TspO/MBR family protein [Mucilaginibacter phyllosphaerae]|uniref:Tryptophan-rich sensory protein n=1 Tax=Mucilaginibacter phyllosphaerae TaxID=1812349 RepID=A0A4Y8A8N5_9SPHI|nr:TspO/MBR family protein [Mucilaginibacter phyllosphaerae]MBB3970735.1 tryptophan-rich sensory protein [Mucilaginibacter phyllosphaerae]TEW64730.1 tryptophan-rich sensory protein [Mucilaginibacter phyllosphaerae]GGH20566.1 TspO and MBR [Mucilaginibacter phyllosphaerae]
MHPQALPNKFKPVAYITSLAITLSIGAVASFFTRPQIKAWYITLNKPDFTPPNWLFPVAWTILYILIATAAYLVWKLRNDTAIYRSALIVYILQLALNFSWSIVFFGMHQITGGLIIIIALLVTIILNISYFGRFSKAAAWLLVPYFLWVGYATLLNISICVLNK